MSVPYAADDIIRVYRSDLKGIEITGTVTGNIPTNDQMTIWMIIINLII